MSKEKSPLEVIRTTQQEVLQLKQDDEMVFDVAASAILAAINPALVEPVWMYFIGPPSSGKTESIAPYSKCPFVINVSTLTENTLASGWRDDNGNDPSLLPQLDGKLMSVKDISPLTSDDTPKIQKIWGDLRDAYDAHFAKATGSTGLVEYHSRFGCIMCATGSIDRFVETHQQLGERFLSFRIHRVPLRLQERDELGTRVREAMGEKGVWKVKFQQMAEAEMKRAQEFVLKNPGIPKVDVETERTVIHIANFLSLLRTAPIEGEAQSAELPSRLLQQLFTVGHAHALMDGRMEWDASDLDIVRRIGVDTFPITKRRVVQAMFSRGKRRLFSSKDHLLRCSRMNNKTFMNTMMQYAFMNAIELDYENETQKIQGFRLTEELYDMLDKTSFFVGPHMPA